MSFRGRLPVLAVAALIAAPAVALAAAASNSQSYPDSTGENPTAPDITSVSVANDDAGALTFTVNVNNRPALTPDMLLLMFIDTVKGKGDPESLGADWAIQLTSGLVSLFEWSGSEYLSAGSQSTLVYSYPPTGPVITVNARELGSPATLGLGVVLGSGVTEDANGEPDFTNFRADLAPDTDKGSYAYDVLTDFSLHIEAFTVGPKPAKAGKSFSAGLALTQSDTTGPVASGTVACKASIAGKPVAVKSRRLRNGVAVCVWVLPKAAAGKQITGSITVTTKGASAKKSFTARVS
jgi:hypothetical protein